MRDEGRIEAQSWEHLAGSHLARGGTARSRMPRSTPSDGVS
jgi:hypothetical protein